MRYHFWSAGSIPGVPGIFAGVIVDVDDATNEILEITPLAGEQTATSAVGTSQSSPDADASPSPSENKE